MLARHAISDADWARIEPLLPKYGPAKTKRRFVDAILFVGKTAIPWRDLPERFGDWNAVWKRFDRWSRAGRWRILFDALQNPDVEWLILDSTVTRAPPVRKKADGTGGQDEQALGRSRGGFGTKIHVRVNGFGLPTQVILSPGQDADSTHAEALRGGTPPAVVIADKGYARGARHARLAVARFRHPLRELGQKRLIHGSPAVLGLTQRPHHKRGVVARGALVFLLSGVRVLDQKIQPAVDRCVGRGARRARLLGRRDCRKKRAARQRQSVARLKLRRPCV